MVEKKNLISFGGEEKEYYQFCSLIGMSSICWHLLSAADRSKLCIFPAPENANVIEPASDKKWK